MLLNRQQARRLAAVNGAARCALGLTALTVPGLPLAPWLGSARDAPAARLLARALGARDLALGAGALVALRRGAAVRGWLEAAGLADGGDALVTLAAFASLPRHGRWAVVASATAGVVAAALAAPQVDRDVDENPKRSPAGPAPHVDGAGAGSPEP